MCTSICHPVFPPKSDPPPRVFDACTVLGGGYIALEFSGIFQRFGSEVHNVFRQPLPLRGFDEEVGDASREGGREAQGRKGGRESALGWGV